MGRYQKFSLIFLVLGIVIIGFVMYSISVKNKKPKVNMDILGTVYTNHFYDAKTKINVFWKIDKGKIHFALESPGQGWVGIGFNPQGPFMQGGDIFMGFVKNNKAYMKEEYANTPFSHESITKAGGKDCILSYNGVSNSKGTTLAFVRNLKSCGLHDDAIVNKNMTVMLAYSDGKDFTKYHGPAHDEATINFFSKTSTKHKSYMITSHLTSYQIGLIAWSLLFILSGIIGLSANFIEKDTSKLELIKKDNVGILPFFTILFLSLMQILCVAWFIYELYSSSINSLIGVLAGINFIIMGIIVLFYRKFYIDDEVIAQDIHDEIPW